MGSVSCLMRWGGFLFCASFAVTANLEIGEPADWGVKLQLDTASEARFTHRASLKSMGCVSCFMRWGGFLFFASFAVTANLEVGEPKKTANLEIGEPIKTAILEVGRPNNTANLEIGRPHYTANLEIGEPQAGDWQTSFTLTKYPHLFQMHP